MTKIIALLVRLLALVGIIATAVPLFSRPLGPTVPLEEISLFVGALILYLGTYTPEGLASLRRTSAGHAHDVELFREFLELLPPASTSYFFKAFDFGNAFHHSEIRGLNRFADSWGDPDKEFRDRKLETKRRVLYSKGNTLAQEIARRTAPWPGERHSVKPWGHDGPRTDAILEDARVLNRLAREFSKSYDAFVRLGRRRVTLANDTRPNST